MLSKLGGPSALYCVLSIGTRSNSEWSEVLSTARFHTDLDSSVIYTTFRIHKRVLENNLVNIWRMKEGKFVAPTVKKLRELFCIESPFLLGRIQPQK